MSNPSQYDVEIRQFVAENRQALSFLLRLHHQPLSDYDLSVFCAYLSHAASRDGYRRNGEIDRERTFQEILRLPYAQRNQEALIKALSWWERGQMTGKPLDRALSSAPPFSDYVQKHLLQHQRAFEYRKNFGRLGENVIGLSRDIDRLAKDLIRNKGSLKTPDTQRLIKQRLAAIRQDIQKCDWSARAGIAWAQSIGIPLEKSIYAVNRVYLKRLARAERVFERLDDALKRQGIESKLARTASRAYDRWRTEYSKAVEDRLEQHRRTSFDTAAPGFSAGP